jgi:hypothetical protein
LSIASTPVSATCGVAQTAMGCEASQSFLVDDRAIVVSSGSFAAVQNSGTGTTQVGNSAQTGAIASVAAVDVIHRAVVNGNIVSASTVTVDTDAHVTGTITAHGTVHLPPLPTLPAFPPPNAGGFTVNSGVTRSAPPASYSQVTVLNGGTLILSSGDYFFQSLTINSGSTIRATPTTRVFVQNALIFNAPILASSGSAVQPIFLGFAGSNLSLTAKFNGKLVAPSASVTFGTGSGVVYTGSFFAHTIEVTPASELVCQ